MVIRFLRLKHFADFGFSMRLSALWILATKASWNAETDYFGAWTGERDDNVGSKKIEPFEFWQAKRKTKKPHITYKLPFFVLISNLKFLLRNFKIKCIRFRVCRKNLKIAHNVEQTNFYDFLQFMCNGTLWVDTHLHNKKNACIISNPKPEVKSIWFWAASVAMCLLIEL